MNLLKLCDRVSHVNEKSALFEREGTVIWIDDSGLFCDVVFDEPIGQTVQDIAKTRISNLKVTVEPVRLPCRMLRLISNSPGF